MQSSGRIYARNEATRKEKRERETNKMEGLERKEETEREGGKMDPLQEMVS